MRQHQKIGIQLAKNPIPCGARSRLQAFSSKLNIDPMNRQWHIKGGTNLHAMLRPDIRLIRQTMMHMDCGKTETQPLPGLGQQMQQQAGIKTARVTDTKPAGRANAPCIGLNMAF